MKNVTLSLPEDLLAKSREYARKRGMSLNELIRKYLKSNVSVDSKSTAEKLLEKRRDFKFDTKITWKREDLYDR
jgi:metal-responsive CopG/Arc/MetJ family transcriptional regulator